MYELSDWFEIAYGVGEDCILLPHLFNIYSESIINASESFADIFAIAGETIGKLRYRDDVILIASSCRNPWNILTE